MPVWVAIKEIVDIECNHYSALFYHDFDTWIFNGNSGILTFSILQFNAGMYYILTIYYKMGGSAKFSEARLFVSNYR